MSYIPDKGFVGQLFSSRRISPEFDANSEVRRSFSIIVWRKTRDFASLVFTRFALVVWFGSRLWQRNDPGVARVKLGNAISFFGDLAVMLVSQLQTHGFASPVFTGFAIFGRKLKFSNTFFTIDRILKEYTFRHPEFVFLEFSIGKQ